MIIIEYCPEKEMVKELSEGSSHLSYQGFGLFFESKPVSSSSSFCLSPSFSSNLTFKSWLISLVFSSYPISSAAFILPP